MLSPSQEALSTPVQESAIDVGLCELEAVYAFIYCRVGNREDAEDLTQEVALKALPRLRGGSSTKEIRGYLYAAARSVLASFWSRRFRLPEAELDDDLWVPDRERAFTASVETVAGVERILSQLSANHRRVLELRFMRGYSLKDVAQEMKMTVGAVKLMQLRALRAAGSGAARHSRQGAAPGT